MTPTTSLFKRKLIKHGSYTLIAHLSLVQVAPIVFSSPGENQWKRGITNEALVFTLLFSSCCTFLSFSLPAFMSSVSWPSCMCGEHVDGPWVLSGDVRPWASPLFFGFDNNGHGFSAVTFHLQRWIASIVDFKERTVGREEVEDGFLYFIFHCMRRFDGVHRLHKFKGFWLIRDTEVIKIWLLPF